MVCSGEQLQMGKQFLKVKNQLLELLHTAIQNHHVDNIIKIFGNFGFHLHFYT